MKRAKLVFLKSENCGAINIYIHMDCSCGLVVRVPGYRPRGVGSIPGTTRFVVK
jgi:hypothetical protein